MPDAIMERCKDFGMQAQPMVHVENMAASVAFYEALGGRLVVGSRDGDWSLLAFGDGTISLLGRPPGDGRRETVELHFTAACPLEEIEAYLRHVDPDRIERGVADEAFGRMLRLQSPDGLLIKVIEVDRDVVT